LKGGEIFRILLAHPAGYAHYAIGCLDRGPARFLDKNAGAFFRFVSSVSLTLDTAERRLAYLKLQQWVIHRGVVLEDVAALLGALSPRTSREKARVRGLQRRYARVIGFPELAGRWPVAATLFTLRRDRLVQTDLVLQQGGQVVERETVLETKLPLPLRK
jgi:hypothetical protein